MSKQLKIGIDLGGTRIKMGLVDPRGKIYFRHEVDTPHSSKRSKVIDCIVSNVKLILNKSAVRKQDLFGIGIGVPGPCDSKKGIVHYLPNVKGWREVPLKSILQNRLNLKVNLDNDVNAMTLAEHKFGAGKGAMNLVCLTLGTGVGGGVIINGDIYRGSTMTAGEIGHIPINENGPKCNCRGYACLERYIGNRYILKRAEKIFRKGITLEDVSRLARQGNKKALHIWRDVAHKLATALTGVINLLNPDVVVIGGGVSRAGIFILAPLRKELKARVMQDQARRVKIVRAKLGDDAGIIGASLLS